MNTDKKNERYEEPIVGRVDKPGDRYKEEQNKADISHVDRQEGTMNNGTIGGNMNEDENPEKQRPNNE